jgi:hypothetical protein
LVRGLHQINWFNGILVGFIEGYSCALALFRGHVYLGILLDRRKLLQSCKLSLFAFLALFCPLAEFTACLKRSYKVYRGHIGLRLVRLRVLDRFGRRSKVRWDLYYSVVRFIRIQYVGRPETLLVFINDDADVLNVLILRPIFASIVKGSSDHHHHNCSKQLNVPKLFLLPDLSSLCGEIVAWCYCALHITFFNRKLFCEIK